MFRRLAVAAAVLALWGAPALAAPSLIIPAADLPAYIAKENPVILVATNGPNEGPVGYLVGTIDANEMTWTLASRSQKQLDTLGAWSTLIGGAGIDGTRPVLVYDDGELKFASRIRYLLAHYGVRTALLVNGGWKALSPLVQSGALKSQPAPSAPVAKTYMAHIVEPPIPAVPRLDVRAIVEDELHHRPRNITLIDVRTPDEYTGKTVLEPDEKPGHIPGAINIPIADLLVSPQQDTLKDPAALARAFADRGVKTLSRTVIFYCQDGARSSLGALAAKEAGFENPRLYYLSFLDWQNFPDDPIVKGPNPY